MYFSFHYRDTVGMGIRGGRVAAAEVAVAETIVGETTPRATSASRLRLTLGGLSLPHRPIIDGTETVVRLMRNFKNFFRLNVVCGYSS